MVLAIGTNFQVCQKHEGHSFQVLAVSKAANAVHPTRRQSGMKYSLKNTL